MKKTLLLLAFASQISIAQVAFTEDFSALAIGNIGSDITGATPGQNNWLTTANNGTAPTTTTNAGNDNFQVVDAAGANGYALQLTGPNGDKGTRIMTRTGLVDFWNNERDAANNIMEVEYDLYTGAATGSNNNMRLLIYDPTGLKILAGFSFAIGTKVLSGVAHYDATANGGQVANYLFFLGAANTNLVLPADSWVRIGFSYNYTTGQVRWKGPGFNGNVIGASPSTVPNAANIAATSGANPNATPPVVNNVAGSTFYDNIVYRATATDMLLDVFGFTPVAAFSAYPNPAQDFLSVSADSGMQTAVFADMFGRVVKSMELSGTTESNLDISTLPSGMYILTVSSQNGESTQKIVKQ